MRPAKTVLRISGYADVEIKGADVEQLLNLMTAEQLLFWDIRRRNGQTVVCRIAIRDFFRLRPLLKKAGCRVHVTGRHGLPFLLDKLEKRKFFAAGFILFLLAVYAGSLFVWNVKVTGNEKISTQAVLDQAAAMGIHKFEWTFRLGDLERTAGRLTAQLPGAAWVGIEKHGTEVLIRIVEAKVPGKRPLLSPRHLVADADAVVTRISVEQGQPAVKTNMHVKKGQILVSGVVGDGEFSRSIVARGTVRGLVWREYDISVPLAQKWKVYTGASSSRSYLIIGKRAVKISGFGKPDFQHYEVTGVQKRLQWRNFLLPLGFLQQTLRDVRYDVKNLPVAAAKQAGLAQAKAEITRTKGKDAKVLSEKILHEQIEDGKVKLRVLFEVDEDIVKEQPILQGE